MKINLKIVLVTGIAFTLALSSCYYDNEEDLYLGGSKCDTTNVTYSATIAPIFSGYCNSCHSGSSPNANIVTDNYTSVNANIDRIIAAINHTGPVNMPPDGSLTTCDLAKMNIWFREGHLDN
jgi:hypothetical protein